MTPALILIVAAYAGGLIDADIKRELGFWPSIVWVVLVGLVCGSFANWQGLL